MPIQATLPFPAYLRGIETPGDGMMARRSAEVPSLPTRD